MDRATRGENVDASLWYTNPYPRAVATPGWHNAIWWPTCISKRHALRVLHRANKCACPQRARARRDQVARFGAPKTPHFFACSPLIRPILREPRARRVGLVTQRASVCPSYWNRRSGAHIPACLGAVHACTSRWDEHSFTRVEGSYRTPSAVHVALHADRARMDGGVL